MWAESASPGDQWGARPEIWQDATTIVSVTGDGEVDTHRRRPGWYADRIVYDDPDREDTLVDGISGVEMVPLVLPDRNNPGPYNRTKITLKQDEPNDVKVLKDEDPSGRSASPEYPLRPEQMMFPENHPETDESPVQDTTEEPSGWVDARPGPDTGGGSRPERDTAEEPPKGIRPLAEWGPRDGPEEPQ
jgi:hypothetical protein